MTITTDLPNGYYQLAPGRLANAVIWLEMRQRPAVRLAEALRLEPASEIGAGAYLGLFAAVGAPWLWSRAADPPESAAAPDDAYVAFDDAGQSVGIVEFDGRESGDAEIVYFGLHPSAVGKGLGRRLMAAALELAWRSAARVWLHTCNFDHPAALRFYESCGFTPYASGIEIMDDPRLDGSLPRSTAPHVPLIQADRHG